jgi:hypothetical protein
VPQRAATRAAAAVSLMIFSAPGSAGPPTRFQWPLPHHPSPGSGPERVLPAAAAEPERHGCTVRCCWDDSKPCTHVVGQPGQARRRPQAHPPPSLSSAPAKYRTARKSGMLRGVLKRQNAQMYYRQTCDPPVSMEPRNTHAICHQCGRADEIAAPTPLFVVIGASASGKTAILPPLARNLAGRCVTFDTDLLLDPAGALIIPDSSLQVRPASGTARKPVTELLVTASDNATIAEIWLESAANQTPPPLAGSQLAGRLSQPGGGTVWVTGRRTTLPWDPCQRFTEMIDSARAEAIKLVPNWTGNPPLSICLHDPAAPNDDMMLCELAVTRLSRTPGSLSSPTGCRVPARSPAVADRALQER